MRFFKKLNRLLEISRFEARPRIKIICVERSWIELNTPFKFGCGIFELPLDRECLADGNMGFSEVRIGAGAGDLARIAAPIARAEGFEEHARSMEARIRDNGQR